MSEDLHVCNSIYFSYILLVMSLPTLGLITPRVLYTLVLFSIRTNNCDFYVPFPPKSLSFLILAAKTEKKP